MLLNIVWPVKGNFDCSKRIQGKMEIGYPKFKLQIIPWTIPKNWTTILLNWYTRWNSTSVFCLLWGFHHSTWSILKSMPTPSVTPKTLLYQLNFYIMQIERALLLCFRSSRQFSWNQTIFNMIRWDDGTMACHLMVQCLCW